MRSFSLPETDCVVVLRAGIVGLQLRKSPEPLDYLVGLARRTVVGLRQEEIAARVRRIEIGSAKQRLDRVVIDAARVVCDSETDRQPSRSRVALGGAAEDFNRGLQRSMQEQFAGPVEKIRFTRFLVGCSLEFIGRNHEVAFLFLDLAKKIV